MCLEDRLLVALYKEQEPVPLAQLSNSIMITENAALSIVHRIAASFPPFIRVENEEAAERLHVAPNHEQTVEVQRFLKNGGFTAINEREFLQYYKNELKRERRRAFFRKITSKQMLLRWLAGTGITVAGGIGLLSWAKTHKR